MAGYCASRVHDASRAQDPYIQMPGVLKQH